MCGVTGFITTGTRNIGAKDRGTYLRQTLQVDSLRGYHSTGVFYAHLDATKAGCGWAKACEHGMDFVDNKLYVEVERKMNNIRFAVGHNRWATTGASDDVDNAHPFQEGDITLVHNGTLDYDGGLITPQATLGVDVDSHAIAHNLALHDAEEVISKLDGAFTLIWHDKRDDSLNFCRNSERPLTLWVPKEEYMDTIYFGSERKMMEWIMSRNHITTVGGNFVDLPTGQLWKFLPGSLVPQVTDIDLTPTMSYWNNRQYYSGGNTGKKRPTVNGNVTPITGYNKNATFGISDTVNAELNAEGFDRSDSLPFTPLTKSGKVVVGSIDCLNTPAIMIGTDVSNMVPHWNKRWTVRPVGKRYTTNTVTGKDELVLICHLRSFMYHDTMFQYGDGWLKHEANTKAKEDAADFEWEVEEGDIPFDPDPSTLYHISPTEMGDRQKWYTATAEGCSMCESLPPLHTSDYLVWLNDGHGSFLCVDCAASCHLGDD